MDAREILTRLSRGEFDPRTAAEQLRGLGRPQANRPAPEPKAPQPHERPREPIAVIGLSARFPGAEEADDYWSQLLSGADLVTEVPAERWRTDQHYDPDPAIPGATRSKWGAFITDATAFDAEFFGMTPREAELTDPQARLFLQEAWRALENAGLRPDALAGSRCGVYAGVMLNDYIHRIERDSAHARLPQVMQGNSNSMLAARLAYELDLRGATATVDTACSSSLVALHLACQALWLGEADMMIAGGVTLYLTEIPHVFMSGAGMLSPTGRERAFDAAADGIVPGEGCAVVVLKPLTQAQADGDPIHAVIRATGINSDGRTNGITAPSGQSQARLIGDTYARFGIDPATIDYVECHGTGTPLGDPIEVDALNAVFAAANRPRASVPIGSVKTNVGHTSAAAGLAGMLKTIGVVNTGEVPPTLHQHSPNPKVPFVEGPFVVADRRMRLPDVDRPRRAAVSSFGFSGTNAHVVVEQPPLPARAPAPDRPVVVPLSARRPASLDEAKRRLHRWLTGPGSGAALADVAHTLAVARTHSDHRAAFVVHDRSELLAALEGRPVARGPADLSALAERYLRGEDIDWTAVYPPAEHRRLALPGYPFAKDMHIVATTPTDPRPQPLPARSPDAPEPPDLDSIELMRPTWVTAPPAPGEPPKGAILVHDPIGDLAPALLDAVAAPAPDVQPAVVVLRLESATGAAVIAAFKTARDALNTTPREKPLTLLTVTANPSLAQAAAAFTRSLQAETPRVTGRVVLVEDTGPAAATLIQAELAAEATPSEMLIDRSGSERVRGVWDTTEITEPHPPAFRTGGVYLVTGGMGGLGQALARHLVEHYRARVVLCGRRSWDDLDPANRPPQHGGPIRYARVDVADAEAVAALVRGILAEEGALHGVVHAAGAIRDAFLTRKRPEDLATVLGPKMDGVTALDDATADVALDLFVLFSSVAGMTGNIGQADYAFGNGYLDGFARQRADRVRLGERSGRTLSIGWPLWDGGGMTVPEEVQSVVLDQVGMEPLPLPLGLAVLERLLQTDERETGPAVSVFHGDREKWRGHLRAHGIAHTGEANGHKPALPEASTPADAAVADRVVDAVATALGRPATDLSRGTTVEALGLDSLMIRTVVGEISRTVAPIGPEDLYGARDLGALIDKIAPNMPAATDTAPPPAASATATSAPAPSVAPPPAFRSEPGGPSGFAVVGLSGRYPDAPDLSAFWENLATGRDTVSDLPTDRWPDPAEVQARGHFLTGIDRFDPEFFGISAHEAALIDPQERLFLEVAWEALENGGYAGPRLERLTASDGRPRSVGVFVGVTSSDYPLLGAEAWAHGSRVMPTGHYWSIANRVSYLLDLHGPSQPVDTACSSSLVALHLACESIRRGECGAALVGGVNLYLHPSRFRMLRQSGFLAEDGRCRSFGAGGTGFGPGEGVGAVLVKPLDAAIADGDPIHGVIRGSAVAHGGRTNGYTAPSPDAQARVIRQALQRADVPPETVSLIEAHGTGTELGDPVEVSGLAQTYGPSTAPPCALGSVKSAIGHGESVAGLAALTKVLLQMRHATLVPTLHADPANPNLRLEGTRFSLQRERTPWQAPMGEDGQQMPRRAGISSFGAGGVNAHVIVEEYTSPAGASSERSGAQLMVLSGPTPEHVTATSDRLARWCREAQATDTPVDLASVAHTLREGRAAGPCRVAVVANTLAELEQRLSAAQRQVSDLRDRRSGHALAGIPEAEDLFKRLWQGGRLQQLGELWLDGLDVPWERLRGPEAPPIAGLPRSALLGRPLWFTDRTPSSAEGVADTPPKPADAAVVELHPAKSADVRVAPPAPAVAETPRVQDTNQSAPETQGDTVLERLLHLAGPKAVGTAGPLDRSRTLTELGVDSINLTTLRFEIEEQFGLTVALEDLADQSVDQIAQRIDAQNGHQ